MLTLLVWPILTSAPSARQPSHHTQGRTAPQKGVTMSSYYRIGRIVYRQASRPVRVVTASTAVKAALIVRALNSGQDYRQHLETHS